MEFINFFIFIICDLIFIQGELFVYEICENEIKLEREFLRMNICICVYNV